ncbi:MAG: hypothetical protein K9K63_06420 [Desulfotignum sp.]|nr:hypothetical protein [Desulfotignum sp.]MCF8087949.1 hypothetical protein [Desulfotignum sp.]MCF8136927.1 hypothetical protein [Desulfotignum sp.]
MATINDVVLIYLEDAPIAFARVENILPDPKKGWFQMTLLMLQIPLQTATWILKDAYINGEEFQMNGKRMRMETIHAPKEPPVFSQDAGTGFPGSVPSKKASSDSQEKTDNIISFSDLKKKNNDPTTE